MELRDYSVQNVWWKGKEYVNSHKTVSSYIEDLENMYVLLFIQYFIDLNKRIPDYSKSKKIYFFDPFIYHLFNRIFYFKDSELTPSLVESVAVVHFARFLFKRMPAGRSLSDFVYYWKNKKETDIIVRTEESIFAAEVKYQNKITKDDFASLYHFRKGIIISKDTLIHDDKYPVIPIHLALCLI